MFKPISFFLALAVVMTFSTNFALADDQEQLRGQNIYGSSLMTKAERAEHRATIRSLKTREERERYRMEHHKRMQERAKEKGISLPEMPMPRGKGMGPRGDGMGPRDGMGPGGGRRN